MHTYDIMGSPVLTATSSVNGKWPFLTPAPTQPTPVNRSARLFAGDYVCDPTSMPNLVHICLWGKGFQRLWVIHNQIMIITKFEQCWVGTGAEQLQCRQWQTFPRESGGGWRKDENSPWSSLADVSASTFFQYFDKSGGLAQRWRHRVLQRRYSMLGLVSTGMGDHLQTGKPPQYFTKPPRPTQPPTPVEWEMSTNQCSEALWQRQVWLIPLGDKYEGGR